MQFAVIGPLHAIAATIGLLSGSLAMFLRKGSGLHRAAGTVFFGSMLIMCALGVSMALPQGHSMNFLSTTLTAYLVTTGWLTARGKDRKPGLIDAALFLVILAVSAGEFTLGIQAATSATGTKQGYPAPLYFIFGTIALLFATGDVRLLIRRGVTGARRLARHLLRMCVALLFAFLSLYPGQARLFSDAVRKSNVMFVPSILVLLAMIFWLCRVRLTRARPAAPAR